MKRRLTRKEKRKKNKQIIMASICLLVIMTCGYATFQTNLSLKAKGNIVNKTLSEQLKENVITSGDGLYKDPYETDRYIFKGTSPNNFINFNNELWRIVSIESDGTIKIIRNAVLSETIPFDKDGSESGSRYQGSSGYCDSYDYACNVWGSNSTTLNSSGSNVTTFPDNEALPQAEASLNIYLNNTYYQSISDSYKQLIVKAYYNIGPVGYYDSNLIDSINSEKSYKWYGNVAMITATELIRASNYSGCTSISSGHNSYNCGNNNYLYNNKSSGYSWLTITPNSRSSTLMFESYGGPYSMYGSFTAGNIGGEYGGKTLKTRPVVTLSSKLQIASGDGSQNNAYQILI